MKPGISFNLSKQDSDPDNWIPAFPNPADFRFDYFKLLQQSPAGLASLGAPLKVAVIGAGAAGMTVARELHRCGAQVTIFEASDRIGGRLYTVDNPHGGKQAGMEMGAMRMPFFAEPGSKNCILDYYLNYENARRHPIQLSAFPNPGAAPGGTGIYINQGHGPELEYAKPTLIAWPIKQPPQNEALAKLSAKVSQFGKCFSIPATAYYTQPGNDWETCWQAIVRHYDSMTFDDLVLAPALSASEIEKKITDLATFDGDLGGFGMNPHEADLLYTIGTGDGSWGAFYSIAALWFLRCTYFGFDSNLQTIESFSDARAMPHFDAPVADTNGVALAKPRYEGIQALVEYLFYVPAPGAKTSLYEGAKLYVDTPVHRVEKCANGLMLHHKNAADGELFDCAVVTSTQWSTQMSMTFQNFPEEVLPQAKITTQNTQHNISSCKLFFPLREKYWELPDNKIPQDIVTDTCIQDMYALSWASKDEDRGVLLASYTWEDDSLKLLPFDEAALSALVLAKLKEITSSTVGQDITEFIDMAKPVMIQWIKQPTYIGCAKLYRAENEAQNQLDLSYNQNYGKKSCLYFAGENYGVEGGWTEPALRSGLDCVLQMLNNVDAKFKDCRFDFATDYPKWPSA